MSDDSDTTGAEWAQGPPIPQSDLPVWVYPTCRPVTLVTRR